MTALENVTELNDSSYEAVIEGERVVLLHFCAEWAEVCRAFHPKLDKLAGEFPSLVIAKIDTSKSTAVLEEFNIESIPTLILVQHEELETICTGDVEYTTLKSEISKYI